MLIMTSWTAEFCAPPMDVKEATCNQELRQFTEMMDTHGYQETGKQDQETLRKIEKRKRLP